MWPAVKRKFTQEGFRDYVSDLTWNKWRPSKIIWHNTAAPTLAQWINSAKVDASEGFEPGISRITNLEAFFKTNNGWSGGPHLFIANDFIWVFNPLTSPGVHSPSYNSTAIGIEMVADFAVESPDSGPGLLVKQNTVYATAILCATLGIQPLATNILLHKEDPKTTHDCPGRLIAVEKAQMILSVMGLMEGGDHHDAPRPDNRQVRVTVDDLNLRSGPGVTNKVVDHLRKGNVLTVYGEAKNGTTTWLRVSAPLAEGWVSGSFVEGLN